MAEDIFSIPDVPKKRIGSSGTASSPASGSEPSISSAKSDTGSHPTVGTESTESPTPNVGDDIQQTTSITVNEAEHTSQAQQTPSTNHTQSTEIGPKAQYDQEREFGRISEKNTSSDEKVNSIKDGSQQERSLSLFSIDPTAYAEGHTRYIRLTVGKRTFERLWGEEFQAGRKYEIKGRIEGIGDFRTHHTEFRKNGHVHIHVPTEHTPSIRTGERHNVMIDSIVDIGKKEIGKFRVVYTHAGPAVRLPGGFIKSTVLESSGHTKGEKIVVEPQILNLSRSQEPVRRCFRSYTIGEDKLIIRLRKTGARGGDIVQFLTLKEYSVNEFVKDFHFHKSAEIQNAALSLEKNKLIVNVDGQSFALGEPRLTSTRLQVTLWGVLESVGKELRFIFDGERVTSGFGLHSRVRRLRAFDYGLEVLYSNGNQYRWFRQNRGKFEIEWVLGRLALISSPRDSQEPYHYIVDPRLQEIIRFRLTAESDRSAYRHEKGNICEKTSPYLLSLTGVWEEVAPHPSYPKLSPFEACKRGPDSLQRLALSDQLYYFEFKWHENVEHAKESATEEVIKHLSRNPSYNGRPVAGAYIGVWDWNMKSRNLNFYVKRVWPQ